MKVACISDLHLDHQGNRPVFELMSGILLSRRPDVLVVAGDLASSRKRLTAALAMLAPLAPRVLYVPGNHDLWSPTLRPEVDGVDTWRIYGEELPALCAQLNVTFLPEKPVVAGDVAFVGTTGWYDYSLASSFARLCFTEEDFRGGVYGALAWMDPMRTCFREKDGRRMDDAAIARVMADSLSRQLKGVPDSCRTVVAVTHFLPFRQLVTSRPFFARDFVTGFLGSSLLGDVLLKEPRVRYLFCGHTHIPNEKRVGPVLAALSPLGYPKERSGSLERVAASRITWWEIPEGGV